MSSTLGSDTRATRPVQISQASAPAAVSTKSATGTGPGAGMSVTRGTMPPVRVERIINLASQPVDGRIGDRDSNDRLTLR
jgi:hypothetical protein